MGIHNSNAKLKMGVQMYEWVISYITTTHGQWSCGKL